jgi:hypothetical protein
MQWPLQWIKNDNIDIDKQKSATEIALEEREHERIRARQTELRDKFTTLYNLNNSLNFPISQSAVMVHPEEPRAVTDLDVEVDSAISGAAPQFIKPDSALANPPPTPIEPEIIAIHSYPFGKKNLNDVEKAKWKKILAELEASGKYDNDCILEEDDDGNLIDTLMPVIGAGKPFQPSLKPTKVDLSFETAVSIGNPKKSVLFNCIENSRGEFVYFKDNETVISEAIDLFNKSYDEKSRTKTVLAGANNSDNYVNFHLEFDHLEYSARNGIIAKFDRYTWVTGLGSKDMMNPTERIKGTCQFYLEGEIMLDETESKIEAMTIFGMNYINVMRMRKGDKFVYVS